uniref:queuine tRNA-ribosyltransferase catalytic subunit 1 isoform X1 n=1 Tax=Agelaius phoeniceus TaxID=39638 RepID=UPI0023EE18F5|nr:queuine tRNA-ribosyltransferase catalytic subunit 1 isoform X1 [Agelaius phoeniceus]
MAAPAAGPAPVPVLRIVAECGRSRARAGELRLPHGSVPCPVFMPVGTRGTAKGLTAAQLAALGCRICLGNTFHLGTRPGSELVRRAGGLHGFMDWPHNLLTRGVPDGFAAGAVGGVGGGGSVPAPPRRGSDPAEPREIHGDPERPGGRYRDAVGRCREQHHDGAARRGGHEQVHSLARSLRRRPRPPPAAAALRHHPGGAGPRPAPALHPSHDPAGRARFRHRGPERGRGQGSVLAHGEAEHGAPAPGQAPLPDGRGVSPGVPSEPPQSWGRPPESPPLCPPPSYATDLVVCVALGCDMFDCVFPTRTARFGSALVPWGSLQLKNQQFAKDFRPIDADCGCPTCQRYSRAYLHALLRSNTAALHLLTLHNIAYQMKLMGSIRDSIIQQRFPEFVRDFMDTMYGGRGGPPAWAREALESVGIPLG